MRPIFVLPLALTCLVAACGEVRSDFIDAGSNEETVTLTVIKNGDGTVMSSPGGLDCGSACSVQVAVGTMVTLTATPDASTVFSGWSGGGCGGTQLTCSITLDADTTVNAGFGVAAYVVSGTTAGAPAGTSVTATSPTTGSACAGNSCTVPAGGAVTLTAPSVVNHYFAGWTGGTGCSSASDAVTLTNVTATVACIATYQVTYTVTVGVVGGTAGTTITPTSSTPGATCVVGSCRVPTGGAVSATSPTLTNWFFNGWTGAVTAATAAVTVTNVTADATVTSNYINTRQDPCRNSPPTNATTTSTPLVTTTYTTAGGWTSPALCPFACNADYCLVTTGASCALEYSDAIAFTTGAASKWFGGDDRPSSSRSVGTGQGVTPSANVTMHRFGFQTSGGFTFDTTGQPGSQPTGLTLERRDGNGNIGATYTTTVPSNFPGGWVYWNTPATTLGAGTLYVFTSWLNTAFTQAVNSGSSGDAAAGYGGGSGYSGEVTSGGLSTWSAWGTHPWDFKFRVQTRNATCQ